MKAKKNILNEKEQQVKKPGENLTPSGAGGMLFLVLVIFLVSACLPGGSGGHLPLYFNADSVATTLENGIRCIDAKPMSGVLYKLGNNRDTLFIIPYINGIEHGMEYNWYDNGQLKSYGNFVNGWKQGKFESWYADGKKRYVYHFKDDVYHGEYMEWYPSGVIFKKLHFKNGQEAGKQQMWYEDGSVRANYEVKGDRVYGLIGTMGCSGKDN